MKTPSQNPIPVLKVQAKKYLYHMCKIITIPGLFTTAFFSDHQKEKQNRQNDHQ